jgi:hypothetical protein
MATWPSAWRVKALESAGIPVNADTLKVMKAWKDSTPLPVFTNNPVGMPYGSRKSVRYMGTTYGMFASMADFYAAFAMFASTTGGRLVVSAMSGQSVFPAAWRAISSLEWPASKTETDYPSALLDLTDSSYRESISATPVLARKTSGTVGRDPALRNVVIAHARSLTEAAKTFNDATTATRFLIRRHARNG